MKHFFFVLGPRLNWRRGHVIAVAVMLLAGVIRLGWLEANAGALEDDIDSYRHIAGNVVNLGVFGTGIGADPEKIGPTAMRPPAYPLLLALLSDERGGIPTERIGRLNLALGMITLLFTWLWVRRIAPGRDWLAAGAVLLVAVDPLLLWLSSQIMTENLAACCAMAAIYLLTVAFDKRSWEYSLAAGLVIGVAALARPTFLPFIPVATLAMGWMIWRASANWKRAAAAAVALGLGGAYSLAPWVLRNWVAFGRPIATTTHGSHTLALGNSPEYLEHCLHHRDEVWNSDAYFERVSRLSPHLKSLDPKLEYVSTSTDAELAMADELSSMAMEGIRQDWRGFAFLVVDRIGQFWDPMPNPTEENESAGKRMQRQMVGAWYTMLSLGALAAIWQHRRRLFEHPLVWGALLCVMFTGIHSLYWSNMRMRAPVTPWMAALSAMGAATVLQSAWQMTKSLWQRATRRSSRQVGAEV